MFDRLGARDRLRERFFTDVADPMVPQAFAIGVPCDGVVARIRELEAAHTEPTDHTRQAGFPADHIVEVAAVSGPGTPDG
jgi:hypothetical protein